MIRQPAIGVLALLASAGAAWAQTETITGDLGFDRQVLRGAELYDATDATVWVENGRNGYGFLIEGNAGATLRGGQVLGQGINRTETWAKIYSKGNGAAVQLRAPNITVSGLLTDHVWDGVKTQGGPWRVERSWLGHQLDDAIEDDGYHPGEVVANYFEGVHTFFSANNSHQEATKPFHIEWRDNVMSLGCEQDGGRPCEDRDKRLQFAWACPVGSGQPWKVRANGGLLTMTFRNNAVMIDKCINQNLGNLRWFTPGDIKLTPESTGNRGYFLQQSCLDNDPGTKCGYTMINLMGARVPQEFGWHLLPAGFWASVSNSREEWIEEVARWRETVWEGQEPEPEPEPEPGAGTDPEILVAVDVRPEQCPNRVRVDRDSNIPVVVVGTDGFDVRDINPTSIRLAGVAPKHDRTRIRDMAGPFEPFVGRTAAGDCGRAGPDGLLDLLLRFSSQSLGRALGPVADGATVVVPLTGELHDGTPIRGEDVIVVLN